jgi:hypothetical protein
MKKKDPLTMFDDPVPNPYPEMEEEVFQDMFDDGLTPADIHGPDVVKYAKWLKKREKDEAKNGGKNNQ